MLNHNFCVSEGTIGVAIVSLGVLAIGGLVGLGVALTKGKNH